MSQIEMLMNELNLKPDTIENTLSKINKICKDYQSPTSFYFIKLNANGNGDGDN
ncbi:MAG: hypothetical protein ACD_20C00317G0018 [uncultured bacterium]|nr:MAG: hypothetical protein ACD_20C00317G0018 [uncultured bacterium]